MSESGLSFGLEIMRKSILKKQTKTKIIVVMIPNFSYINSYYFFNIIIIIIIIIITIFILIIIIIILIFLLPTYFSLAGNATKQDIF